MLRRLSILLLLPLLSGCFTHRDLVSRNLAAYYRPDDGGRTPPEFRWYVTSDTTARLYLSMNVDQLLYVRQPEGAFGAQFECHIELLESYDVPTLIDSFFFVRSVPMSKHEQPVVFSFEVSLKNRADLLTRIRLTDGNRGTTDFHYVLLNASTLQSRDAFQPVRLNGEPVFGDRVRMTDTFSVQYRDSKVDSVWCKRYRREFPLAAPPFSFDVRTPFDYSPDSVFRVDVNHGAQLVFSGKGFYHFQVDTSVREGFTLYCSEEGFPNVVTTRQMADPIRYLCSRQEFAAIDTSATLRKSVDRFWLERSSWSEDRSRILIRKYYTRVANANRWFSSYTEGWRTDRGMIYVIFGPPNTVYRYSDSETWIYGTENSPASLNLLFVRVENPFTKNDFVLSRSPIYESHWYRGVEFWRQGRAYNTPY
ncbi:MAG: hypothetical protein RL021_1320 [Bacteroidota bacterium]|jgi:GWxTD domain-containing protein